MLFIKNVNYKKARIVLRLGGENPRKYMSRATVTGLSSAVA